jgi:phosphohistidine phosphatase
MSRILLLMRHAETETARPGHRDLDRRLTETGLAQAAAAGHWLRARYPVDTVLCSPSVRTRETLAELGVGGTAEFPDWLYNAGGDTILEGIRGLPEPARTALVIGHAPGIPAVAHELADPVSSAPAALTVIASRFPAGTLCVLRVERDWAESGAATLLDVRLPDPE